MVTNRDAGHEVDRDTGAPQDSADGRAACRTADDDSHSMPGDAVDEMPAAQMVGDPGGLLGGGAEDVHRNVAPTVVSTRMPLGHTGPRADVADHPSGRLMHRLRQSMPAIQGQLRGPLPAGGHQVWLGTTEGLGRDVRVPQQNEVDALDAQGADEVGSRGRELLRVVHDHESQVGTHRLSEPGVGRQRGGHRTEQPRRVESTR